MLLSSFVLEQPYAAQCKCTSENPVKRKFNFGEDPKGEVRRTPIPRTPVNKGMKGRSPIRLAFLPHSRPFR
jgi:hypothetical protein